MWVFYVGFHSHVWGGSGAKQVANCSNGFEVFVYHLVAYSRNIFCLENCVSAGAYMEDVADSLQNVLSPHKTEGSKEPLYLNLSESKI